MNTKRPIRLKKVVNGIEDKEEILEFDSKYACAKWLQQNFRPDLPYKKVERTLYDRIRLGFKIFGYEIEVLDSE